MHSSGLAGSSHQMQSKRPPNLSLQIAKRPPTRTIIELQTPVDDGDGAEEEGYDSSSSSSSSGTQPGYDLNLRTDHDFDSEDISEDLAVLEQLRRSVNKNLRLRPIRSSSGTVRTQQTQSPPLSSSQSSDSPLNIVTDLPQQRSSSPDSAFSPASAYYTPLTEFRATPLSAFHHVRYPSLDVATRNSQPQSAQSASVLSVHGAGTSPALLLARLSSPTRPLLIDTRSAQTFATSHIRGSVNMAIPSLILKRSRKPAGAFQSLDAFRQFITTEDGQQEWDELLSGTDWDGDVIVYDETMNEKDRSPSQVIAWSIVEVVAPLLHHGCVDFLEGGFAAARQHPYLSQLLLSSSDSVDRGQSSQTQQQQAAALPTSDAPGSRKPPGGLFQLDTTTSMRSKTLPEIERPAPSPQPLMPTSIQSWNVVDDYSSPSPAPSSTVFSRPQPPRRPSIPTLRRIDTDRPSASLPKLQVPRIPLRANTLAAPTVNGVGIAVRYRSRSPSHLNLVQSNHSPPGTARLLSAGPITPSSELLSPPSNLGLPVTPRSPSTPLPFSPPTPRADIEQPPTTEEPFPEFTISTILPGFLYLGPELTSEEHVESLLSLGVKRIVNIAVECDDDRGLNLRERFDRYVHIPMRDNVEEDNITRGVREVCTILDDARLHSAPTYVHCKAGKSRSVTAVMAYLIHANHWTLSQAYTFVLERRKGISPNIGFVSELMTFEEQELGGKSVGVVKMPPSEHENESQNSGGATTAGNYSVALGGRRPPHIRESLPPAFASQHSLNLVPTLGVVAQLGDSQQELEIKDSEGRYRHARRAPVDEATLQPLRRVSKAGLESAINV